MVYLKKLVLPSDRAEVEFIKNEKRTCFHTFYPFKIFPDKGLSEIHFDSITMFYGGNGSGKSTLLNVLAEKIRADRFSEFNDSPLFGTFVDMCYVDYFRRPRQSLVLTSDDVFDYALGARSVNQSIDERREALFDKYVETHRQAESDPDVGTFHGLDDYERWREVREILSPRRSQSQYIKNRLARDIDLCSNGETAMRYFLDRIDADGIYLLDEPENSLSVEYQIQLADYIAATARATRTQFIIATHSPILLSMSGAQVYDLDSYPASVVPWTQLPNVRRYFDFFMEHQGEFD